MNTEAIELSIVKGAESGLLSFTPTGLKIAEDTTWEQWLEGLKFFKWAKHKLAIGMGDYITFGTKKFGTDHVNQALEQYEFDLPFVKAAIAINSIPEGLRFPNLDGDHYIEIARANVPQERKIHWARIASEQGLTPIQLKFSMIENNLVNRQASKALHAGTITIQGLRQQFDLWLKRVGGLEGITKMEDDHQVEIMEELDAIVDFGEELREHLNSGTPA